MPFKTTLQAGFAALVLAGFAACQKTDTPDDGRQVVSNGDAYRSSADVHFVYDNEGKIARQLPVDVLKNIQAQLRAQGQTAMAQELESLYDFATGEVKNVYAAEKAEGFLKANLPQAELNAQAAAKAQQPGQILRPEDLPAGISIPPEMIETLRKQASEAGAR